MDTEKSGATARPWRWDKVRSDNGAPVIVADRGYRGTPREICKVLYAGGSEDPEVHENARYIVTACNAHADLVAALTEARCWLKGNIRTPDAMGCKCHTIADVRKKIDAALTSAS